MSTHNVYLPDDLGERAKSAGLNLSALLRAAVNEELSRMEALASIGANEYLVRVEDSEGNAFTGRITGELIDTYEDNKRTVDYYLTNDGRLLAHDDYDNSVSDDLLEVPNWQDNLAPTIAAAVGERLGISVIRDL